MMDEQPMSTEVLREQTLTTRHQMKDTDEALLAGQTPDVQLSRTVSCERAFHYTTDLA